MDYDRWLTPVLQEIFDRWSLPALAVGIVRGDEIVYTQSFGVQRVDTRVPVTVESVFCVASISKVFVATAVMQLAERGKIDLDAPLVRYLPYFALDDPRYPQITIRQVLSHTAGMPDHDDFSYNDLWSHPETDAGASERYVRGLRSMRMVAAPGESFRYSNIGYNALGDMIAKVSGVPFEDYLGENVLIPAGMPHSTFVLASVPPTRLAMPHMRAPALMVSPIYVYHRADAPASALHSTVTDMCHWSTLCLNRGHFAGWDVLTPAGFAQMWTPVVKRGGMLYADMGLGWNLGTYKGERAISHGGFGGGLADFWVLLPEKNLGAVIMCTDESPAIARLRVAVLDAMVGAEPRPGTIDWIVPISQALADGGIEAANARCAALKASGTLDYERDEESMCTLALQLLTAGKFDLAIGVLGLNLREFPRHAYSYYYLGYAYLQKGDPARAEASLARSLAIEPGDGDVAALLDKVRYRV
jgi:CubicO group peptidase (beta-lactamase class C family)